jgi:hypothetical protein
MQTQFSYAAVALLLLAGTGTASAQIVYTPDAAIDTRPLQLSQAQRTTIYRTIIPQGRGRQPIVRERIVTEPVAPIVQDRVITRSIDDYAYGGYGAYGYGAYGNGTYGNGAYGNGAYGNGYYDYGYVPAPREYVPAPRERIVTAPRDAYAYAVGARVPATVRLAPLPPAVVADVPAVRPYRYFRYFDRVLLVDPVTSTVVADVTGY